MALVLRSFARTVPSAGTAVVLSPTQIWATAFMIQANATNTGYIYVGDSTVSAANAPYLVAGATNEKEGQPVSRGVIQTFDLSQIYINASVAGEGVKVEYIEDV